jgi:hypothetical protein
MHWNKELGRGILRKSHLYRLSNASVITRAISRKKRSFSDSDIATNQMVRAGFMNRRSWILP